jgi:hypothetical protein
MRAKSNFPLALRSTPEAKRRGLGPEPYALSGLSYAPQITITTAVYFYNKLFLQPLEFRHVNPLQYCRHRLIQLMAFKTHWPVAFLQ